MLRLMLSWLATLTRAETRRVTVESLDAGYADGLAEWASRRAAELGVEPPKLEAGGPVPAIGGGDEEEEGETVEAGAAPAGRRKRK